MTTARNFLLSILASLFILAPVAGLSDEQPPRLAEIWTMTPKADQSSEFFEGLARHMEFRNEAGDPRIWKTYMPQLGEDLGRVALRFCCMSWADADAYREWDKENPDVNKHFNEHVVPHAENYGHFIREISWVNSNVKSDWSQYRLFGVTEFALKPGKESQFDAARDQISQIALNNGWATDDHPWLWSTSVGGAPTEFIVVPYERYADMDRDGESFFNFLSRVMGSEESAEDLFRRLGDAVTRQEYQIWELHENLSMKNPE